MYKPSLRGRRRLLLSGLSGGLLIACSAASLIWWHSRLPAPLQPPPETPAGLESFVREMLGQEAEDQPQWEARSQLGYLQRLVPLRFWSRYYLTQYAEEKLLAQGDCIIDPLLRAAADPALPQGIRAAAQRAIAKLDDPRVVDVFLLASDRGLVQPLDLLMLLDRHLPLPHDDLYCVRWVEAPATIPEWLREFVRKDYGEARLQLLDTLIYAGFANGGMSETGTDERVLRWLNRIYDVDLDEWLAKYAPAALRFRNAQIRKGYDPIVTLRRLTWHADEGADDEALKAIFASVEDREACNALLESAYPYVSSRPPVVASGWKSRLCAWYGANRRRFAYDFRRHRFVVRDRKRG